MDPEQTLGVPGSRSPASPNAAARLGAFVGGWESASSALALGFLSLAFVQSKSPGQLNFKTNCILFVWLL